MQSEAAIITQCQKWIQQFVIGLNFCPFANFVFVQKKIDYQVLFAAKRKDIIANTLAICQKLTAISEKETALLILATTWGDFNQYLNLVEILNNQLKINNLSDVFQIATFHPDYVFEGKNYDDASNFTNRSPYPILHILRQSSITWAVKNHPNTLEIPKQNIQTAEKIGYQQLQNDWEQFFDE